MDRADGGGIWDACAGGVPGRQMIAPIGRMEVGWEPENAPSLWEEICESHSGTADDPIPYSGNMPLTAGLYYVQEWVVYRCIRDTINPVYNALADLVGLYVTAI